MKSCELATETEKYVLKSPGPRAFPGYISMKGDVIFKKESEMLWYRKGF